MASPDMTTELRRLSLLRQFKIHTLKPGGENLSPFAARVVTAHDDISKSDLTGLHAEARDHLAHQIAAVHAEKRSQVVLLSGDAGSGKSHILRYFAQPSVANEHQYFFVGGSNDWKVDEFKSCLLDWMIQALTARKPDSDDHPLLDRIRAIGFSVVGQLLQNRTALRRCTAKRRRALFGLPLYRKRATYEQIKEMHAARNPDLFGLLDFARFADEACVRFLAEPGNPVHGYAFKVLLTYLFPNDEPGLGTRERVVAWFRRKPDGGYWLNRFKFDDNLDKLYAVADAIKLLVHLFSPDVSSRLSAEGPKCPPRVFLCVFDQAEGRDELFETLDDWRHFFAHLSELYNTLPNVMILFTMTIRLRNELHPKMEGQFRDRIRKDERFVLRMPSPEQLRDLYRARVRAWLAGDLVEQDGYDSLPDAEKCLPFDTTEVVALGGGKPVRAALESFHAAFRDKLRDLTIDPEYDFEYIRNEQQVQIAAQNEHEYTADHLDTVWELLEPIRDDLAAEYGGVKLMTIVEEWSDSPRVLRLDFADPAVPSSWVIVYLTRFGNYFKAAIQKCENLLFRRQGTRYSVWMVRANKMSYDCTKPDLMHDRLITPDTEARLWSALHVLGKRTEYATAGTWGDAWKLILAEIRKSYLGELLAHARDRVHALRSGAVSDNADEVPAPMPAAPEGES